MKIKTGKSNIIPDGIYSVVALFGLVLVVIILTFLETNLPLYQDYSIFFDYSYPESPTSSFSFYQFQTLCSLELFEKHFCYTDLYQYW